MATHPDRNRLLQCLGGIQPPQPDWQGGVRLAQDDILLLCSDGFWGPLTQRQMLHALLAKPLGRGDPASWSTLPSARRARDATTSPCGHEHGDRETRREAAAQTARRRAAPGAHQARLHQARRRLGAGRVRRHAGAVHRERRGARAAVPQGQRPRLGHRRVRHAAARDQHAQRARGGARQAVRPHAGDPAPDRARAARGRRPRVARASAPSRSTATCSRPTAARAPRRSPAPSSRCTTRVALADRARGCSPSIADHATSSPRSRSACPAARRCSTSTTPRTRRAAPT